MNMVESSYLHFTLDFFLKILPHLVTLHWLEACGHLADMMCFILSGLWILGDVDVSICCFALYICVVSAQLFWLFMSLDFELLEFFLPLLKTPNLWSCKSGCISPLKVLIFLLYQVAFCLDFDQTVFLGVLLIMPRTFALPVDDLDLNDPN